MLLLGHGLLIVLHQNPRVCVTEQVLRGFQVNAFPPQQVCHAVTERVPSDLFIRPSLRCPAF